MGIQERKAREKRARQEAILQAARQVFLAKGLDQATIEEIAEIAELSKGTIYLYFSSKEELYISVLSQGLTELIEKFRAISQKQGGNEGADTLLRTMKDEYYAFFATYPEFFHMNSMLYQGRIKEKVAPDVWKASHEKMRAALTLLADIIEHGVQSGIFRQLDSWRAANSLWGAATGVMLMLSDEEHQELLNIPVKELVDETIDMLIMAMSKQTDVATD